MCSGRVDLQFVLEAFAKGADGVLIGGCHPGDCHYQEGNYKCLRRFRLLQRLLKQMGIEEERLRLEWISAAEGERVRVVINDMVETLKRLGPAPKLAEQSADLTEVCMKPKVAFYWCASCGGCEEAVVDLAEDILPVLEAVDIVFWPVALDFKENDVEAMADGSIDVAFINGAVRTTEQLRMARLMRAQVALRGRRSAPAPNWAASRAWPTSPPRRPPCKRRMAKEPNRRRVAR